MYIDDVCDDLSCFMIRFSKTSVKISVQNDSSDIPIIPLPASGSVPWKVRSDPQTDNLPAAGVKMRYQIPHCHGVALLLKDRIKSLPGGFAVQGG